MRNNASRKSLTRRDFLRMGCGLVGAAAGATVFSKALLEPQSVVEAASAPASPLGGAQRAPDASVAAQGGAPNRHFVATDGWIYMPPDKALPPYHPDNMAPDPLTTYIFGFRDVTPVMTNDALVKAQKMKAQLSAPLFWLEQEVDFTLKLTNLGLQIRPDLIDAHTLHFHGFRNAIPIFDGEPHSSTGVPISRDLVYFYRPHDPGTYMYHCHFEETEHVHMGMIGPVFITPIQNYGGGGQPATRLGGNLGAARRGYVYNDGDGSTAYDREYIMLLGEVWAEAHWCDSHIQLPDWTDYDPEFYVLNGRVYPDTLAPNGEGTDLTTGDLIAPPGRPELQYQPMSSLVQANEGESVLFRIINLGFEQHSMRLDGIKMRVVGKDAMLLRGLNGADLSFLTSTVYVGPGESNDAIFVAPTHSGGAGPDRYFFYNRDFHRLNTGGHTGYGGMMTEVHVYPAGTLPAQTAPNT